MSYVYPYSGRGEFVSAHAVELSTTTVRHSKGGQFGGSRPGLVCGSARPDANRHTRVHRYDRCCYCLCLAAVAAAVLVLCFAVWQQCTCTKRLHGTLLNVSQEQISKPHPLPVSMTPITVYVHLPQKSSISVGKRPLIKASARNS